MATTMCTVCGCKILDAPTIKCPKCETPHHEDCWSYNGGCGIFACNPATRAVLVPKPAGRAGPRAITAMVLLYAIVFGGFIAWMARTLVKPAAPDPVSATLVVPPADIGRGPQPPTGRGTGPRVGLQAPDFRVPRLDGSPIAFHQLRAGRPAILTFWLAYCADCMPHVPEWAKVYEKYQDSDRLALVNVAAFPNEATVRRFRDEFNVGGTIFMDSPNVAVPTYQLSTITTFLVDRDGVILYRGGQDKAHLDQFQSRLEELLGNGR